MTAAQEQAKAASTTLASTGSAPTATGTQQDDSKVVFFREVISPVSEGTCRKLTRAEMKECYERYSSQYGKDFKPPPDEDPTESQLAALRHLLAKDQNPYTDLAVFVQYGDRAARKQKCRGLVLNTNGE